MTLHLPTMLGIDNARVIDDEVNNFLNERGSLLPSVPKRYE